MTVLNLEALGLTDNESNIYIALLQKPGISATDLSKSLQMNRISVYDSLVRLEKKGYITHVFTAKKKEYAAVAPELLLDMTKKQYNDAVGVIEELKKLHLETDPVSETSRLHGKAAIRLLLFEVLRVGEMSVFGDGSFRRAMPVEFKQFIQEKKQNNLVVKYLLPKSMRYKSFVKTSDHTEFRTIGMDLPPNISIWIYGKSVAIIDWLPVPVATKILNENISTYFRLLFNYVWENGDKAESIEALTPLIDTAVQNSKK